MEEDEGLLNARCSLRGVYVGAVWDLSGCVPMDGTWFAQHRPTWQRFVVREVLGFVQHGTGQNLFGILCDQHRVELCLCDSAPILTETDPKDRQYFGFRAALSLHSRDTDLTKPWAADGCARAFHSGVSNHGKLQLRRRRNGGNPCTCSCPQWPLH